jgi:hypothetical protein
MDQDRFAELEQKRFKDGLTDQEANELGRMMAEQMGKPYGNADQREHPDSIPGQEGLADREPELRQEQQLGPTGGEPDWIGGPRHPQGTSGNAPPGEMPDEEMREAVGEDVGAPTERRDRQKSA